MRQPCRAHIVGWFARTRRIKPASEQYGRRHRTLAAAQIEALLVAGLHAAKGKSLLLSATVVEQDRGIGDRPRLLDHPLRLRNRPIR